jgi:hypothetical protein
VPATGNNMVVSNHSSKDRFIFLKALAIRLILEEKNGIQIEEIVPAELLTKKKDHNYFNGLKEYRETIKGLLPWFLWRGNILRGVSGVFKIEFQYFAFGHSFRQNPVVVEKIVFESVTRDVARFDSMKLDSQW